MASMRMRPWMLLLAAVTCAGLSAYLALGYLAARPRVVAATSAPVRQMLVAARELPVGSVVGAADVKLVPWPSESLPEGFMESPQVAVGRGVITPLRPNEPLLASKLAAKEGEAGLAPLIPPGYRAVSVEVDEVVAVAGFVGPGSRVDLLATLTAPHPRTRTILQDVQVVAAGQSLQASSGEPQKVSVVTLLVTPEDAEALALAIAQGRIHLALRNGADRSIAHTSGAEVDRLTQQRTGPVPAPPTVRKRSRAPAPGAGHVIEVFNGNVRSVASF